MVGSHLADYLLAETDRMCVWGLCAAGAVPSDNVNHLAGAGQSKRQGVFLPMQI